MAAVPVEDAWADVVISNGAINLTAHKACVFREAYRMLMPGGRGLLRVQEDLTGLRSRSSAPLLLIVPRRPWRTTTRSLRLR